ncbi:glutamate-1-semialdehyde 2,1-aminomutase [Candidatus Methylopumilus planktonicus]|uniref:glutamate-1-semialdehyde 2,1-aminomutase n=1 Tax=Candidatus Methylopumilus planktonicus TaxID=1581557 RepID=UPI003BEF4BB5
MMKKKENFANSRRYSREVHDLIPGGAHTYSKGDDQFPINAPSAITHGKGAHVWDVDGNEFIDCSMGLSSVSIGHGYEPVAQAVADAAFQGTNFQRPALIELEAAKLFLETVQSGDMVKFAKNGSTVVTAAVKLARAFTGRNRVAICREHNFFSFDDWFIVTTPCDRGIPEKTREITTFFSYNNIESVEKLLLDHDHDIACLILEPVKFDPPENNFLHKVAEICKERGVILILDEMVSGFKWSLQGAHNFFGVKADISTWGKGIANGFSACALTGRAEIMELGGIRNEGEDKLFLISTTHGAETTGLAAMNATIKSFVNHNMIQSNWERGSLLKSNLEQVIVKHELQDALKWIGYPCLLVLICRNAEGNTDDAFRTLMMQEMIARGILFQGLFYTTWSHQQAELDHFVMAFDESCAIYKQAIKQGNTHQLLIGRPAKAVFRKKI